MKQFVTAIAALVATMTVAAPAHAADTPAATPRVVIDTSDVERFFALYDDPQFASDPDALSARYLATPSPGLVEFMKMRRITPERIASALRAKPQVFADARGCAAKLDKVRSRLVTATYRLAELYPPAKFPPITIAIGRAATVGTANEKGLYIGLEALCAAKFMEPNDEDRFVNVIAHEYIHAQQPLALIESEDKSVLFFALVEGAAEFVAEQISGSVGFPMLHKWAKGREAELETAFLAEKGEVAIGSRWLYNQQGTTDWPGDLGYWVGYRVAKAHYTRSADKAAALREIIEMKDPAAFLAESGWTPGMAL